jgi:hypothetical protein
MAYSLITLEQAKLQLRITHGTTEFDDDIVLKMDQATAIVMDYLKRPTDQAWEAGSPGSPGGGSPGDDLSLTIVQAAILEVLTNLFMHRGDDAANDGPITPRIESMLRRLRDPALA